MTPSKVVGDLQRLGIKRSRLESPGTFFVQDSVVALQIDAIPGKISDAAQDAVEQQKQKACLLGILDR